MAHLLIIEDEPTGAEVARIICEAAGHTSAWAAHGREALERLAHEHFDLLLMDVQMPVMDGLTLTRTLRADPRYRGLPILGLTAKASREELAAMRQAGMDDVLTKPYRNAQLRAAISHMLADRELTGRVAQGQVDGSSMELSR